MTDHTDPIAGALDRRRSERQGRYESLTGTNPAPMTPEQERWELVLEAMETPAFRQAEAEAAEAEERAQEEAQAQHMALNGAELLRHALAGATGTVNGNGAAMDSAADLIRWALPGGVDGRMDAG
jgi:hypothetical protein